MSAESIDYIIQHLEEELSLDTVAAHFFVSKFYFGRIFREETGETLYSFIKRCRVDQSAVDMKLNPTKAITDIGLDYGYSSSNYSSVFRKRHNTSPAMFRQSLATRSMPRAVCPGSDCPLPNRGGICLPDGAFGAGGFFCGV